jgi:hypothetical protein
MEETKYNEMVQNKKDSLDVISGILKKADGLLKENGAYIDLIDIRTDSYGYKECFANITIRLKS